MQRQHLQPAAQRPEVAFAQACQRLGNMLGIDLGLPLKWPLSRAANSAKLAPMNPHTLIIEPGLAERHYWRDLWRYRELFSALAWRDLTLRYKQTLIGLARVLQRPLLTMIVFTLIFGTFAKPSPGAR